MPGLGLLLSVPQWFLVVQILWISCVLVPFTIMAVIFYLLDWLMLDKFAGFIVTGNWNDITGLAISPTSPLAIMGYVGLVFGFILLFIFLVNYASRNVSNFSLGAASKRLLYMGGFGLYIILIPFACVIFLLVVRLLTNFINQVISLDLTNLNMLDLSSFGGAVTKLLYYTNPQTISQETWNQLWKSIDTSNNSNLLNLKNELLTVWNNFATSMNSLNFNSLMNELNNIGINNLGALKELFNKPDVLNNISEISSLAASLSSLLKQLESAGISATYLNPIQQAMGLYATTTDMSTFLQNYTIVATKSYSIANLVLDSNNQIVPTNNLGFLLYTAVTGTTVNDLNGIWGNWSFIGNLFAGFASSGFAQSIINLIKSIFIGGLVAMLAAKGIGVLISLLIGRWFTLMITVPYGAFAVARSVNDDGALFKLWIREWITVFITLFIVSLNFTIMKMVVSVFLTALNAGNLNINGITGISNSNTFLDIAFCIITIVLIYANNAATTKILETFNNSSILRENSNEAMVNEYRRANSTRRSISANSRKTLNSSKQYITDRINNKNGGNNPTVNLSEKSIGALGDRITKRPKATSTMKE